MKNKNGIDYGELSNSDISNLDKKAYSDYYNKNFSYSELEYESIIEIDDGEPLSYNEWYDNITIHQKYINIYLRKQKLIKINKSCN